MKTIKNLALKASTATASLSALVVSTFAAETTAQGAAPDFSTVSDPIVRLINSLINPALAIVGALGSLFCIILGVKFAKAEEPQEREKAKSHLKNAIIGFVLIFVLMLAIKLLMPIMKGWAGVADTPAAAATTTAG